jgi:hypothetical protein
MKTRVSQHSKRGAAFITTLVFTGLLLSMSAAILTWSTSEARLNRAHSNRMEARNATEALLDYGAALATKQVQEVTEYSANFCSPSSTVTSLNLSAAHVAELFDGTNIDPAQVEIVGKVAQINTAGGYNVRSDDPRNAYSTLRGLRGKDGRLTLVSRASSMPDSSGRRQTVYMQKTYTVLDAPVLQYAAFFNMDLEIAPGPNFNIYGPVHTNRNLWLTKQSSDGRTLSFWEAVTAVGFVKKGYKVQPIQSGGTREASSNDPIRFITPSGSFVNLYGSYGSFSNVWRDQMMGGTTDQSAVFRAFSNATYGSTTVQSNLQTSAHGVLRRALPGELDNYVPDPNPIDGIIDATYRNVPHALIERPLYSTTTSTDVEYIGQEVEMQKMSRKAGLYIIVNASGVAKANVRGPDNTWITNGLQAGEYRAYVRNPSSTTLAPTYTEVKLPGQPAVGTNTAHPWVIANAATLDVRPLILVRPSQMTDMRRFTTFNPWAARSGANPYIPKRLNLIEVDMTVLRLAVDYTVNGRATTMLFPYDANWGGSNTPVVSSNTDPRYRSTYRSTIAEFGVNSGAGVSRREGLYTHTDNRYAITGMAATDWDGSMYIEAVDADFENTAYASGDATAPIPVDTSGSTVSWRRRIPGHRNSGVRLINGRGPIASANAARIANTAVPCSPGLTLTTNDALYVLGHLNADGRVQTTTVAPTAAQLSNMSITDDAASGNNSSLFRDPQLIMNAPVEEPLALVADAITILSNPVFNGAGYQTAGWCDALSDMVIDSSNYSSSWSTTPPSSSNQRDGNYTAPASGRKWVFEDNSTLETYGATLSPLRRYLPGTDTNPREGGATPVTVLTSDSRPAVDTKFRGATTEISAGFIVGLSPSANNPVDTTFSTSTGDGNNSGGLHNLPRFLESWNTDCAIRGSMVVMFESSVAWEPWSLRMYGPPGRQWGFHNFFRNFYFSDDIPATRSVGITNADTFQILSRAQYITARNALWTTFTFPTPP